MLLPHDLPRTLATWKTSPEDFEVTEEPAYDLDGQGEHFFVEVKRRDMTTHFLIDQMSRYLNLSPQEFGYAGLKDRCAVAQQRFSIHGLKEPPPPPPLPGLLQWKSLGWHSHKLRRGHLKGNHFRLVVDTATVEGLPAILDELRRCGWANYYGEQRFGIDGDNQLRGKALLRSHSRSRSRGDLSISAYQSHLYNRYLERRIADGHFSRVVVGDLCARLPEGGMFVAEDLRQEQARLDRFEISTTGPIFGSKMRRPEGIPALLEERLLAEEELTLDDFRPVKAPGSRRRSRLPLPADFRWEPHSRGLNLSFFLPAGSYATVFLAHLFQEAPTRLEPQDTASDS